MAPAQTPERQSTIYRYGLLQPIFYEHGIKIDDGIRLGLSIAVAFMPVLERSGELISREPDGNERVYVFP